MICAAAITMERIVPPAVFYLKSRVPRLCTDKKFWFMKQVGQGAKNGAAFKEKISPPFKKKYALVRESIPVLKKGVGLFNGHCLKPVLG